MDAAEPARGSPGGEVGKNNKLNSHDASRVTTISPILSVDGIDIGLGGEAVFCLNSQSIEFIILILIRLDVLKILEFKDNFYLYEALSLRQWTILQIAV
jgi:hypothetical protein